MIQIIEIKAKCDEPDWIRYILQKYQAKLQGKYQQVDTYFKVSNGRLKLRESEKEVHLIQYDRPNQAGPKLSNVNVFPVMEDSKLKAILSEQLGVLAVVDKTREVYSVDNLKFHIDEVEGLGDFMEIEAINVNGEYELEDLEDHCQRFLKLFRTKKTDLLEDSYSDMILRKK